MDRQQHLKDDAKNSTDHGYSSTTKVRTRPRNNIYTAIYDYNAAREDELSLRKGQRVQVLSTDAEISGDEGWWTGQINDHVGIFPANFVKPLAARSSLCEPNRNSCLSVMNIIRFDDLILKDVIGIGGFGKVYRGEFYLTQVAPNR